jgi:hypothetical protein
MKQKTIIIIASSLAVAAFGAYFYFDYMDKQRQKVYDTETPVEDALNSLEKTATQESVDAFYADANITNDYPLTDVQAFDVQSGMGDY